MHIDPAQAVFQFIALLFAISIHEAAHAWSASLCGDQTARMLGRVTLNPIKHADPIGTVLMPLIALFSSFPLLGWGKPTPVTPRNFRRIVRDDILVSLAGPASNLVAALGAVIVIKILVFVAHIGQGTSEGATNSILTPLILLLGAVLQINVVLAVFNVIPIPPLDGSHVLRHFLSGSVLRAYDAVGMFGLLLLVFFGGRYLSMLINPVLDLFARML